MGALIAARLLVTHPDRLRTVTLGGAGAGRRDKWAEVLVTQLAQSLEQGKGIGPLIVALTPPGRPRPSSEQIELVNRLFTSFNDQKALAAVVRGWKDLAVSDAELKANRVPVLAIVGSLDPAKKGVDALEGRLPHLKVVVIPGADHLTAFTRPEFLRSLRAFLDQHGTAGAERAPKGSTKDTKEHEERKSILRVPSCPSWISSLPRPFLAMGPSLDKLPGPAALRDTPGPPATGSRRCCSVPTS